MTRKKQVYLFLLSLSMMILIGCGKSTSETKEVAVGDGKEFRRERHMCFFKIQIQGI